MTSAFRFMLQNTDAAERLALLPAELQQALIGLFEQACDMAQEAYGSPHGCASDGPHVQSYGSERGGKTRVNEYLVRYLEGYYDKQGRHHQGHLTRRLRGIERDMYAMLNPDPRSAPRFRGPG